MASTKIETKVVVSTTTDSVELGKEVEKLIVSFNSTKAALKALEAQKLEVEGQIRELLGRSSRPSKQFSPRNPRFHLPGVSSF